MDGLWGRPWMVHGADHPWSVCRTILQPSWHGGRHSKRTMRSDAHVFRQYEGKHGGIIKKCKIYEKRPHAGRTPPFAADRRRRPCFHFPDDLYGPQRRHARVQGAAGIPPRAERLPGESDASRDAGRTAKSWPDAVFPVPRAFFMV